MEDLYTSTPDGAMGFERVRAKRESIPDDYSPDYDDEDSDRDPNDDDDYDRCNCSDPGCPCGGNKHGRY